MKTVLSLLIASAMLNPAVTPADLQNVSFPAVEIRQADSSGICGKKLTWEIDGSGTLTIRGKGSMYDWYLAGLDGGNYPLWHDSREFITSVVIENGVSDIGAGAFRELYNVKSVSIPDSVTAIGNQAFGLCRSLDSVEIPKSVKDISDYAFDSDFSGEISGVSGSEAEKFAEKNKFEFSVLEKTAATASTSEGTETSAETTVTASVTEEKSESATTKKTTSASDRNKDEKTTAKTTKAAKASRTSGTTAADSEKILIVPETLTIIEGQTGTIIPVNIPEDEPLQWASDDISIVSVDNGKVTANKAGTASVYVVCGGKIAECPVTVLSPDDSSSGLAGNAQTGFAGSFRIF